MTLPRKTSPLLMWCNRSKENDMTTKTSKATSTTKVRARYTLEFKQEAVRRAELARVKMERYSGKSDGVLPAWPVTTGTLRRTYEAPFHHLSGEALVHIRAIHAETHGSYGWPRVWRTLRSRGLQVGK
jgi:hypothetical protein